MARKKKPPKVLWACPDWDRLDDLTVDEFDHAVALDSVEIRTKKCHFTCAGKGNRDRLFDCITDCPGPVRYERKG